MSQLPARDVTHIFETLRKGDVPNRGIETFAVNIDDARAEIGRQLQMASDDEGSIKFLRGGYGCGKTFMARLATLDAQQRNFATSFVVVSDNDLKFHRFEEVYRKVVSELGTATCPRGALGDILDRWIGRVEDRLIDSGADADADDFDQRVRKELEGQLASLTGGEAPADFVRVVQTIFDLKQEGEFGEAGALLSWLSGSANVASSAKKRAQVKGDIGGNNALAYLRGILEIVKAAGYAGLVIVIDEAETILRFRSDSRHKSLNGIRQILDAATSYPGLLWIFTGTPEFYDGRRGVAGLQPLHERIQFRSVGGFANLRQPQLNLKPFNKEGLEQVALNLRELFPTADRARLEQRVSRAFIRQLVDQVTAGFRGDVGVVPRLFLREFVDVLDLTEQHPDFDPIEAYEFKVDPSTLSAHEQAVASGQLEADDDDDDGPVPVVDTW